MASKDSFVFSSDWHLRDVIWSGRDDIRDDTAVAASAVIDHCIATDRNLVLGGDNFNDPWPSSASTRLMQRLIDRLHAHRLKCFMIDGNHDAANPSWINVVGAVNVNDASFLACDGIRGHGITYRPKDNLMKTLAELELQGEVQFLVMHQLLDKHCPKPGIWNMAASWFTGGGPKLVLMGDYHEPCDPFTNSAGVTFHYNGSPCAMTLGEIEDNNRRRFTVVKSSGGRLSLETLPSPTRAFFKLIADNNEQLESQLTPALKSSLEAATLSCNVLDRAVVLKPVLLVHTPPTLSGVRNKVVDFLGESAIFWHQPMLRDADELGVRALVTDSATDRMAMVHKLVDQLLPRERSPDGNALAHELTTGINRATEIVTRFVNKELAHAKDEATRAAQLPAP